MAFSYTDFFMHSKDSEMERKCLADKVNQCMRKEREVRELFERG